MRRLLQHKRKFLPLFIGLLLIGLLIGLTIPLTGLAVPAENKITDFFIKNPQESVGADKISLRFAFSTDSKNYAEYGVVYSNTSDLPVVGKDGCTKNEAWKVHSSANSNLEGHYAGSGRYWVETKIGNIWHTQQDKVYYVRAYVKVGDTYYYGDDVIVTTANQSVNHKHTVPSPSSTTSAVSLVEPGERVGTCSVCGRSNKTEYVNPAITTEHLTSSSSGTLVRKANIYSSMLHGARHFYPDEATNDGKGNDLLIEFSFLWNPSLANLQSPYMEIGRIANSGGGDGATPFYLNFADNVSGEWVPFAGSFEGGAYNNVVYGPAGVYQQNPARSDCAFIGAYGWHRIGVRIHEDAWINGNVPNYRMTATLYVDGQALSQLSKIYTSYNVNLLYTASVVDGELQYVDIPDGRTVYGFRLGNRKTNSGTTADFIYAEYSVTCNREFQQDVEAVPHPIERLPSNYSAPVFYKAKTHESMPVGDFDLPPSISNQNPRMIQPTEGQHPRLLITTDNYQAVRNTVLSQSNASLYDSIVESAVDPSKVSFTLTCLATSMYQVQDPNTNTLVWEEHQMMDGDQIASVCGVIRDKAFVYQINDMEKIRSLRPGGSDIDVDGIGLQAISMMMDLLDQIDDVAYQKEDGTIHSKDKCRTFGEVMFTAALVYDWCYDLLDSAEKDALIRQVTDKLCKQFEENPTPSYDAAKHRMEVSFPPYKQSPVNDHGCERQILRDYLSFSLAIFDEDRSWYDYVGGRFFAQFVPVRNEIYQSDYSTQGFSNYLQIRFSSDLWSAWLMESATGVFPYASQADMMKVMRSAFTHLTRGNWAHFYEGDYEGVKSSAGIGYGLAFSAMMSGYLFEDETAMGWAAYRNFDSIPNAFQLILRSKPVAVSSSNMYEGLTKILYNGGYLKQTIAHNAWTTCDTAVFMKIGGVRIGGHDHDDAGSFQIIYNKSPMAVDSGVYDTWNSKHHKNYHRRTIAHNSVVFYSGSNVTQQTTDFNGGGTGSLEELLDACENPNVTHFGHEEGYASNGTTPRYAYLAGDIAGTYEGNTVTRMDRRMLAVYDNMDADVPLYFFVFDATVTTDNAIPAFLLHVPKDSTSSKSEKSITVTTDEGKLILQNVYCGNGTDNPTISEFFGANKYKVGNNNWTTGATTDPSRGRYEIKPTSSQGTNYMLNAIMVTGEGKDVSTDNRGATYFSSGSATIGTKLGNVAVLFVKSANPTNQTLTFTASTNSGETLQYYVSGLAAGNWHVTYGNNYQDVNVSAESHLLQFEASGGSVTLTYTGSGN